MGLVAGERTPGVGPFGPRDGEVVEQHVRNGFPVVAHHSGNDDGIADAQEFRQVIGQIVTPTRLEFSQEVLGPVGTVHFVGIVEEGMGPGGATFLKGLIVSFQKYLQGVFGQVVHDQTLTTWSGSFDLLERLSGKQDEKFAVLRDAEGEQTVLQVAQ